MKKRIPYNEEEFRIAVAESVTIHGLLRRLNRKLTGGNHIFVKDKIKKLGLDTSHFTGKATKRGIDYKGNKLLPEQVLVFDRRNGDRTKAKILRKAMLAIGLPYRCMVDDCTISNIWNGKELDLQIDHINGNPVDNRRENLRFICPNCHTQTPTHSTKKKTKL